VRYQVTARNTADMSANKIHDDDVARSYGFERALVPGVDVYGYLARVFVARWGRAWLDRGSCSVTFVNPAYDGDVLDISSVERDSESVAYGVTVGGRACAAAHGALPDPAGWGDWLEETAPGDKFTIDEISDGSVRELGSIDAILTPEDADAYLDNVQDADELYTSGGLAHPGWLLTCANTVLKANVALGPWIHTASTIQSVRAARRDEAVRIRARTARSYAARSQRFLDLDIVLVGEDSAPLQYITHTAIVRPALHENV
jgi:hypothetical protein